MPFSLLNINIHVDIQESIVVNAYLIIYFSLIKMKSEELASQSQRLSFKKIYFNS